MMFLWKTPIQSAVILKRKQSKQCRTNRVLYPIIISPVIPSGLYYTAPGDNEVFYDSQDVGVVCNFPDSLKVHGLNVTFSGDLKVYDGELKPLFPGDTLYHLLITNIAHRVDDRMP